MKIRAYVILFLWSFMGPNLFADTKGLLRVPIPGQNTDSIIYKQSHALLIGASNYTNGWPKLESIPNELKKVELLLKSQGFTVQQVLNPNSYTLKNSLENFIDQYGYDSENRLLVYFSGHGHTMDNGEKGYLVPVDAPHPDDNPKNFRRKALDMNRILSLSREMIAKHALFLFDSCFSGTIFKQRNLLPKQPTYITSLSSLPVRQFITAGSAGESVPAISTFTPIFIDAIQYGIGDLNKDGFVSGTELGLHMQASVPQYTNQSPQYGKINDYSLSRGDFIFKVNPPPKIAQSNNDQQHVSLTTVKNVAAYESIQNPVNNVKLISKSGTAVNESKKSNFIFGLGYLNQSFDYKNFTDDQSGINMILGYEFDYQLWNRFSFSIEAGGMYAKITDNSFFAYARWWSHGLTHIALYKNNLFLFAQFGVTRLRYSSQIQAEIDGDYGIEAVTGAGIQFKFYQHWMIRGEYSRTRSLTNFGLQSLYMF